jgi:hypothetical protein
MPLQQAQSAIAGQHIPATVTRQSIETFEIPLDPNNPKTRRSGPRSFARRLDQAFMCLTIRIAVRADKIDEVFTSRRDGGNLRTC